MLQSFLLTLVAADPPAKKCGQRLVVGVRVVFTEALFTRWIGVKPYPEHRS